MEIAVNKFRQLNVSDSFDLGGDIEVNVTIDKDETFIYLNFEQVKQLANHLNNLIETKKD